MDLSHTAAGDGNREAPENCLFEVGLRAGSGLEAACDEGPVDPREIVETGGVRDRARESSYPAPPDAARSSDLYTDTTVWMKRTAASTRVLIADNSVSWKRPA